MQVKFMAVRSALYFGHNKFANTESKQSATPRCEVVSQQIKIDDSLSGLVKL